MKQQNDSLFWWKEYFIYEVVKTLSAGAGTTFENTVIKMDSDANFELNKTTYLATSDLINLKMKDDSFGRYLLKDPVNIKSVAGKSTLYAGITNSFLPFIWPVPYLLAAGSTLTVEAADYSGSSNTMRLALHGAKVRPGRPPWIGNYKQIPMVYSFSGGNVTVMANSTAVAKVEIDIDSHFLIQKITGIRTSAASVSITEGARGREWSNVPVHINNLLGDGLFPNILPAPRFIHRGSTIIFNLTDTSQAENIINICLIGVKLFDKKG